MNLRQKKRAVWLFIVFILSAGFELLGVSAILPFVQAVISPDELMDNVIIAEIVRGMKICNSNQLLLLLGVGLILIYILKNIFMLYTNFV